MRTVSHSPRWNARLGLAGVVCLGGSLLMVGLSPIAPSGLVGKAAVAATPVLQVTDVSPDAPYGSTESNALNSNGQDASGRVQTVVVDPSAPQRLFAATPFTGVWTSPDGGRSWQRSNRGLMNLRSHGYPLDVGAAGAVRVLAVDETDDRRLLYATADDDARPDQAFGGLYVSTDGATSWRHVDTAALNCPGPGVSSVAFSGGRAFVLDSCGVATSNDLLTWTPTSAPAPFPGGAMAVSGQNIYGCAGTNVYRSSDLGASWSGPLPIGGSCMDLAVVPDDPSDQVLAVDNEPEVFAVDFASGASAPKPLGLKSVSPNTGSGTQAVYAARRPGTPAGMGAGASYDILASAGGQYYQYVAGAAPTWTKTLYGPPKGVHDDTWGLGIDPGYDPAKGNCTVYIASDGGVFTNQYSKAGPCTTIDNSGNEQWVHASGGLHVEAPTALAVISQPPCDGHPCPALYEAAGDNSTWVSTNGGVGPGAWQPFDNIGDSGDVLVDPALPSHMVDTRNGSFNLFVNPSGPPTATSRVANNADIALPNMGNDIQYPPPQAKLAQVMTPPGDTPLPKGDYFGVQSGPASAPSSDVILRNQNPDPSTPTKGWDTTVSSFFANGELHELQPSGGHANTTLYALAANPDPVNPSRSGKVFKGQVDDSTGKIATWTEVSTGLAAAEDLFVDPYDPNILYASDTGANTIVSSRDGGATWTAETELTRIATKQGEFDTNPVYCPADVEDQTCVLTGMHFVRDHSEMRFAALGPGGFAFSRDGGSDWIPLIGATQPNEKAQTSYYDPQLNPQTGAPSLYVSPQGGGVQRVDAPFPTLEAIDVDLAGLEPGNEALFVDDTTGVTTPLSADSDGHYHATELVDSATTRSLDYHLRINGISSVEFSRQLTAAETAAGVARLQHVLTLTYAGDTSADYHDAAGVSARLELSSTPLVGAQVAFGLGTQACQAATDTTGTAHCSITLSQPAGLYSLTAAALATSAGGFGIRTSAVFTVTPEEDVLTYTGPTVIANGQALTLGATLFEEGTTPVAPSESVLFTVGTGSSAQTCSAFTDATGTAQCTISAVHQPLGSANVTASFAGDGFYRPASSTATTIVFAFLNRGAFVIGDRNSSAGARVTWWGATWSKSNQFGAGQAPAAFKGFAANLSANPPACGSSWTSDPGDSAKPPAAGDVPSYMGVVVASGVSKSGSALSGDTPSIVVVRTDAGYRPDPGHAGTGTVVARYC